MGLCPVHGHSDDDPYDAWDRQVSAENAFIVIFMKRMLDLTPAPLSLSHAQLPRTLKSNIV